MGAVPQAKNPTENRRLDSWKDIAAFFGRDKSTVRRWELERGLPVHRVPGDTRGAVFAFTNELEEWLRRPQSQPDEASGNGKPSGVQEVAQLVGGIQLERLGSHTRFLPWVVAVGLVIAVSTGVYSYRQTAHFNARAAAQPVSLEQHHVPSPEAQEFYLKGRYYWSKRTPDDLNKAVDYFTQAIVKDPSYAPAFVGLADCYNLLREFSAMPGEEAFPRALAAAQRAVELDDSSAEAHNSLAFATFYWNWDAPTAEREFKRALELNPDFVQGHHWYATFLLAIKRFPEALDQIEQARKLDPSSTTILADKDYILWISGHKKEGFSLLQQLETADSSLASAHSYLAQMYFYQNDYTKHFAELKRAAQLRNDRGELAVAEAAERGFASGGIQGMHEQMLPVQEKLFATGKGSAYELASTCAALGRNQDSLRYLQAALDKHDIGVMFLRENPNFERLHDDTTYKQIAATVAERLPKPPIH